MLDPIYPGVTSYLASAISHDIFTMYWFMFFAWCLSVQPVCSEAEFMCGNGQCIPLAQRCDLNMDCADGTDEITCGRSMFLMFV